VLKNCGLDGVLNGVSDNIVSYSIRSVVPLASEGHVSPRSRYWSLGDEAVSVDGSEQHDNSARQQILMTHCQSKDTFRQMPKRRPSRCSFLLMQERKARKSAQSRRL
jgi:hypothetical protein